MVIYMEHSIAANKDGTMDQKLVEDLLILLNTPNPDAVLNGLKERVDAGEYSSDSDDLADGIIRHAMVSAVLKRLNVTQEH